MLLPSNRLLTVAVVVVVAFGLTAPAAGASHGGAAPWAASTAADLEGMIDRYNTALDGGATARLTGERVTLRVTSDVDGRSATFGFRVGDDGRIRDFAMGARGDATLRLSTGKGTVDYVVAADNPVRAFASVFGRLGDVRGPGVTQTPEGYAYTPPWDGRTFYVVAPANDDIPDSLDMDADDDGLADVALVVDLRNDRPAVRSLRASDLDGDGRPDVATLDARERAWTLLTADGVAVEVPASTSAGDCDDDDADVRPGVAVSCTGSVTVEPGNVYISVEEEGVKRTVREDANRVAGDGGDSPLGYSNLVIRKVSPSGSTGGPGFGVTVVTELDRSTPLIYEALVYGGGEGQIGVYVPAPATERITPIEPAGVGLVNGIKWRVVSFLLDLGVL